MLRKTEIELRKLRTLVLLKKGESHEVIAEKLGMTLKALRAMIYRMRKAGVLPIENSKRP